jgi:hypothetical protein
MLPIELNDINNCIHEINWKLGFGRESGLNESREEVSENIILMKFF